MKIDECYKLLQGNITNNYRKIDSATISTIILEAKIITEKLTLEDKIEKFSEKKSLYYHQRLQTQLSKQREMQAY